MSHIKRKLETEHQPPKKIQKTHDLCVLPVSRSIDFIQFLVRDSLTNGKDFNQTLCNLSFSQLQSTLKMGYAVAHFRALGSKTNIDAQDKKLFTLARLLLSIIYNDSFLSGSMDCESISKGYEKGKCDAKTSKDYIELVRSNDMLRACNGYARAAHQTWLDAFHNVDQNSDFCILQRTLTLLEMRTFVFNYIVNKTNEC